MKQNWWKAIWAALVAFFAALRGQPDPADAQAEQDQIVQETQEVIDEIPEMSDDDLLDVAHSTGLVRSDPGSDPGPGASGADDLADDPDSPYRRYSKTPCKADRKPDP